MVNRSPSHEAGTPASRSRKPGRRARRTVLAAAGVSAAMALLSAAPGIAGTGSTPYTQTNLISDIPGVARITDPNLVNPWGVAEFPGGPLWVADNGANVATLYTGDLAGSALTPASLVVKIPGGAPTGQIFNGTSGFVVHHGAQSGSAKFIFSSETGVISGWSPTVGPGSPSTRSASPARSPTRGSRTGTRRSASRASAGSCTSATPSRTPSATTTYPGRAADSSTSTPRTARCSSAWCAAVS